MIRPYSPISPASRVSVELKHGETVTGSVQGAENGFVGIVFDATIDVLALLDSGKGETRPRMPRIELSCTATLRQDGEVFRAKVINISQGGICISSATELTIDADVVVSLPGLHSAAGVVKWVDGESYGIGFNRVYPVHELMRFLREQQGLLSTDAERQAVA